MIQVYKKYFPNFHVIKCITCGFSNSLFVEKREINLYYNVQEKFIKCQCCNQMLKITIENEFKTNVNVERIDY